MRLIVVPFYVPDLVTFLRQSLLRWFQIREIFPVLLPMYCRRPERSFAFFPQLCEAPVEQSFNLGDTSASLHFVMGTLKGPRHV